MQVRFILPILLLLPAEQDSSPKAVEVKELAVCEVVSAAVRTVAKRQLDFKDVSLHWESDNRAWSEFVATEEGIEREYPDLFKRLKSQENPSVLVVKFSRTSPLDPKGEPRFHGSVWVVVSRKDALILGEIWE